ncbi:hypothetical protein DPEC_G00035070 [Dallia pectoralis]|uniref:Uncharacterized protein n=1 Tax=Dallia pectoralis TaxID=75939 RepID=A0ACC2HDZ4_DALPE|nr:hypothetical protein DPEC_G00035070 [Dallia pectoralis]
MAEKAPIKSTMVSRLPKFGVRPTTLVTSPLSNGIPHPTTPTQECKILPPGRPNGVVRPSSFSLKWKKGGGSTLTTSPGPDASACPIERRDQSQTPDSSAGRELKKPSMSTPKVTRRSGSSMFSTSSPKAIPCQVTRTSPKAEPGLCQRTTLSGVPTPSQNGAVSGSCPAMPRASSSSPHSSSRDSLSLSSDSLKSLTLDNMVRSQSFTHFMQLPSPTSLPMARSFSFNRAVELAKPLANTQLQPPRSHVIKPSQLSNGRLGMGLGLGTGMVTGLGLGGYQYPRSSSFTSSPSTNPSAQKNHLQPTCVLAKSSALGHRLTLPGQMKPQKPLFTGRVKGEGMAGMREIHMSTSPPLNLIPEPLSDGTSGEQVRGTGDGLEDMSLSSASSLSWADTSEEFLDDFDNLGDGEGHRDVSDNRMGGCVATQTRLQSFLNETMDWAVMGLSGQKEVIGVEDSYGILNPERGDLHQALELSPSNSSGGTYMWDEEILEPLGPSKQHWESYNESDHVNRLDILNNLEPADLEDDDVMLGVDLPEESALLNELDSMAHSERSERGSGHWRKRQHRWNGPNPFNNDNRSPVFQQYNGCAGSGAFRVGPRLPPVGRHDVNTGVLDELTLKHMAQDCSSVKNKLLTLKSLLQMEEGGPEIVEDNVEENIMTLQLDELMKEVQRLRDELKTKERTISQLTQQQLSQQVPAHAAQYSRCDCHQRSPSFQGDARTHHDKATQTPWRGKGHSQADEWRIKNRCKQTEIRVCSLSLSVHPGRDCTRAPHVPACPSADRPQILQPSSPHERLSQERIVKTAPIEVHSDPQRSRRPNEDGSAFRDSDQPADSLARGEDTPPVPDPDELSVFFSTQLNPHDRTGPRTSPGPSQGFTVSRLPAPGALSRPQGGQRTFAPSFPRVLQPPRLHKCVSIPALPQESPNAYVFQPGSRAQLVNNGTNQLPPPSRGLPCINSGPMALGLSLGRSWCTKPRLARSSTYPNLEEQDKGLLRDRVLDRPLSAHSKT